MEQAPPDDNQDMFAIEFLDEVRDDARLGGTHRVGRIIFSDGQAERFRALIDYWRESDYEAQWRDGVMRLLRGAPSSCLVTSIDDPHTDRASVCYWAMFRREERVTVEQHIQGADELPSFDPADPYATVGELEEPWTGNVVALERDPLLRELAGSLPSRWPIELEDLRAAVTRGNLGVRPQIA